MTREPKSLIRVKRKVTYTEGDTAQIVTPVSPQKREQQKNSKNLQKAINASKQISKKPKVGEKMWRDVPSAIRFAKSTSALPPPTEGTEKVDDKLREMCEKVFVTGEMASRPYTLEEIGSYVGISRERVRQIQESGLNNMRSIMKERFGWELSLDDIMLKEFSYDTPVEVPAKSANRS